MSDRENEFDRGKAGTRRATGFISARKATRGIVFAVIAAGIFAGIGTGSLCAFGAGGIAAICPLGALETMFGALAFIPREILFLAAVIVIALALGKAFCGWICPVPPLSSLLSGKKTARRESGRRAESAARALDEWKKRRATGSDGPGAKRRPRLDSRHIVLGGSLAASALCGFPVFCLVCPIGIVFATVLALVRLFGFNEPSVDLVVFPALLVFELTFLRNWCHRLCPVGALLSLIASCGRATEPKVDTSKCARHAGGSCAACALACPELADPCADLGKRPLSECVRCGACMRACPNGALSFLKKRQGKEDQ